MTVRTVKSPLLKLTDRTHTNTRGFQSERVETDVEMLELYSQPLGLTHLNVSNNNTHFYNQKLNVRTRKPTIYSI